jgi:hydrocephalus-inducing protein
MRPFREDLRVTAAGVPLSLTTLSGACLGTDLQLASETVPFGTVALGSRAARRVQLSNTGDVGAKFTWDGAALGPNFSITPLQGFLAPGQARSLCG